jgi:biotin transporter BioY
MINLIVAIIIGTVYYKLAEKYEKSQWYSMLGAILYFGSQFVFGVFYVYYNPINFESLFESNLILKTLSVVVGSIVPAIVYFLLKRKWKRNDHRSLNDIDRIGKDI